jgi:hypothetical protein
VVGIAGPDADDEHLAHVVSLARRHADLTTAGDRALFVRNGDDGRTSSWGPNAGDPVPAGSIVRRCTRR